MQKNKTERLTTSFDSSVLSLPLQDKSLQPTDWAGKVGLIQYDRYTGNFLVTSRQEFKLKDGTVIHAGQEITDKFWAEAIEDSQTGYNKRGVSVHANDEFLKNIDYEATDIKEIGWHATVEIERTWPENEKL